MKKVLVVDDDPDFRTAVSEFLNMRGFEVIEAGDGLEALLRVKRAQPDAVVLDIVMPRLGGLQVLKRIQAFDPRIRVVVVCGLVETGLRQLVSQAGADAVLAKPVALADIVAALGGGAVAPGQTRAAAPTPPGGRAQPTERILVVDDEPDIRSTFEELLADKGYDVRTAADGASAVRAVAEDAPDVVLLDIQMPGLGGVDALAAIHEIAPEVKVIMVSGIADVSLANRALAYGAFDYVPKPVDLAYLERSVETALMMRRLERGTGAAPG